MSNDLFDRPYDADPSAESQIALIFMSKRFPGIELDRGRGKIYAELRRRLVSTKRHTHDKALRSVPSVSFTRGQCVYLTKICMKEKYV